MSTELSKWKQKRGAVKASTTRLFGEIENEIANIETLDELLAKLIEKESLLKELDLKIEDLIDADEIKKEYEQSEEYSDKMFQKRKFQDLYLRRMISWIWKTTILMKSGKCFSFFQKGHLSISSDCMKRNLACFHCKQKHHYSVCMKQPENESPVSNNDKEMLVNKNNGSHVVQNSVTQNSNVILQTVTTVAVNKTECLVRYLLNGGSQTSFINKKLSKKLNLPVTGEIDFNIHTFGSSKSVNNRRRKVKLKLVDLINSDQFVIVEAIEYPVITAAEIKMSGDDLTKTSHSLGIELSDDVPTDQQMYKYYELDLKIEDLIDANEIKKEYEQSVEYSDKMFQKRKFQDLYLRRMISWIWKTPVTGEFDLNIHTFGSSKSVNSRRKKLKLKFVDQINPDKFVIVEAIEYPVITAAEIKMSGDYLTKTSHSLEIELSDDVPTDQQMYNANEISLLLGNDVYWKIVTGKNERINEALVAVETRLEWCIQGSVRSSDLRSMTVRSNLCLDEELSNNIKSFWEIESLGIAPILGEKEDIKALSLFKQSIRIRDGRYEVNLPWENVIVDLHDNFHNAEK
nr:uncharacterized protein LOC122272116 [Parasteatoda tepidariorum]